MGRSPTRWTDGLVKAVGSRQMQAASNRGNWRAMRKPLDVYQDDEDGHETSIIFTM